ncbi:MAG TPA: cytochrome P450 [Mycobacteriales bacterium]|nr:cytochrome P450 [Mycobacteriales bacterium]
MGADREVQGTGSDPLTQTAAPVEFDPFSDDFYNAPWETYRRMRDEAPVYYNDKYDFYAITRHADVLAAYRDTETFSSARGIDLGMVLTGTAPPVPLVILMDPPEHRTMRSLVNRVFTPKAVGKLEPMVRETITRFLSQCDPAGFDVVQDFSALFPVEIITTMLGVEPQHRQQIRHWIDKSLEREPGSIHMTAEGVEAGIAGGLFYFELIQQRRADPKDDMISALIEARVQREDGTEAALDDAEIAGFCSLLGGAGAETVTKLIGNAAVVFSENPDVWERLKNDRDLIPAAVEELLRYEAPAQYMVRWTEREVTLHGVTIPKGKAVMIVPAAANRDERAFANPDVFDIDRPREEAVNVGFGYGIHSCLGAALARMESRIALDMLLDFMPHYEVDRNGLSRVAMTNVSGWHNVPVKVLQ